MSWFPQDPSLHACRLSDEVESDEAEGTEISPGVIIERRYFLWLAGGAAAAAALPGSAQAGPLRNRRDRRRGNGRSSAAPDTLPAIEFPQLIEDLQGEADSLIASEEPNEEQYLRSIAARLQQCGEIELAEFYGQQSIEFATVVRGRPLMVYQIRFEPGARIPLHDHRQYNGVLFGLEGEVQVRNFDYLDRAAAEDSNESFQIRETQRNVLTPGVPSTLTRTRDNLHEVTGGEEGGVVLDLFTFFQNDAGSNFLDFNDAPLPDENKVYEAAWQ